ncbi:MAG: substrate-binding domain-containing protein [Oscillospiraceae bacterium]|nr:substrate-binding domain-containing protein [Oscillospiraceae bacterium]
MKNGTCLIGVIGAEVSSIEQRRILSGIIRRTQEAGAQTVVLSNLYNPFDEDQAASAENRIYELITGDRFDALIVLSECFVNPVLRRRIREQLLKLAQVPLILVGASLPEFEEAHFPQINTSDENDLEAITDYLIEQCGFRQISLLTGPLSLDISHVRIGGYRKSLKKHGIPYESDLVIEGNFWYDAGEKLAQEYLRGARREPEAVICSNDYMAFGLLDAFADAGEDISSHIAVIGYEFIPERNLHTPLLMTYRRNRIGLGAAAADILLRQLSEEPQRPFEPPTGSLIGGFSCPCDPALIRQHEELAAARLTQKFAEWNLGSGMEYRLTECRNIEQFAEIMGEFLYLVRDAVDVVLCLFEDWYRHADDESGKLVCRNINPWADHTVFTVDRMALPGMIRQYKKAAVGYINPICFKERLLGYCMVWYDKPDTYDEIYLHWLKTVANGLEFLRLKGDVRFLLQCRTLSQSYDSLTGMFSADGLRDAYQLMLNAQQPQRVTAVAFRLRYGQNARSSTVQARETVSSLMVAAGTVKRFHGSGGIIGRISEFEFLLLFCGCEIPAELLADSIYTEMMYNADFIRYSLPETCLMCSDEFAPDEADLPRILERMTEQLDSIQNTQDERENQPHYHELKALHDRLHREPLCETGLSDAAQALHMNINHFNRIYGRSFGVSFHQDHILARLRMAKHLLISGDRTVAEIAEACGYTDSKYFIRQFTAETAVSPKQYRQMIRNYLR